MNHIRKYLKLYLTVFLLNGFALDDVAAAYAHISHEELEKFTADHIASNRCTPHSQHQCNPLHEMTRHEQLTPTIPLPGNAVLTIVFMFTGRCVLNAVSPETWNNCFDHGKYYRLLINSSILV